VELGWPAPGAAPPKAWRRPAEGLATADRVPRRDS
jgi:hypothetical protein